MSQVLARKWRPRSFKELVGQGSAAGQQQAKGAEQVSEAIVHIEKVTQTTAATAEESAAASEELNAQAEGTIALVHQLEALVGDAWDLPAEIPRRVSGYLSGRFHAGSAITLGEPSHGSVPHRASPAPRRLVPWRACWRSEPATRTRASCGTGCCAPRRAVPPGSRGEGRGRHHADQAGAEHGNRNEAKEVANGAVVQRLDQRRCDPPGVSRSAQRLNDEGRSTLDPPGERHTRDEVSGASPAKNTSGP